MFVHKFEGHEHEDPGAWEAHIKIEIRDENDDDAPFARVTLNWNGTTPGSAVLVTNKDGKWDDRLGPFSDSAITFRITNVELSGFAYRPSLNEESPTIVIVGPD